MKKCKKNLYFIAAYCFLILFFWILVPQDVSAASNIDTKKPISITVNYEGVGKDITNVRFKIYHVADIKADGTAVLTKAFEKYAISLNDLDDEKAKKIAATLVDYIIRDNIKYTDSGKLDSDGKLEFPTGKKDLFAGVYLIISDSYKLNGKTYEAQPMLISLPYAEDAKNFQYHMEVAPKDQIESKTTEITAVKIWKEETKEYRPSEIEVQLINKDNGKVHSTVTLNKKNNWRYTWENLPIANWRVVEKEVPKHYTVTVERDEDVVVLTNRSSKKPPEKPDKPEKPKNPQNPDKQEPSKEKLPQTGTYWWPVPVMTGVGLFCIACGLIWRRYEE